MLNSAMVFPGQGSQSIGMLQEIAERYSIVGDIFASVSDRLGYDLWQLVQEGPIEKLNQTEYTQVAILTADVCIYKILEDSNTYNPRMMAGHSLGEYAALVCANAIDLCDAASLVSLRGKLMQETIPLGLGAMAAILGLTDEQVLDICEKTSSDNEIVSPANYNAIGQVVIAGHANAVGRAIALAENVGASLAKIIPVSVPCHCPLLYSAADRFSDALAEANFKVPNLPVISNVDLSIYKSVEQIKLLLQKQLYSPVQWVKTIQFMRDSGVELIVECGPGKVLSGLVKRIDRKINVEQASSRLLANI